MSKYLTAEQAEEIIKAFTLCYQEEIGLGLKDDFEKAPFYKYTDEDEHELVEGLKLEGVCRDLSKDRGHTMAGLKADIADERQHHKTDDSVKQARAIYQQRSKDLEQTHLERERIAAARLAAPLLFLGKRLAN